MRRRSFLALGITGTAALAAAGWWFALRGPARGPRVLDDEAVAVVSAIVPAVLDGALPPSGHERQAALAAAVDAVCRAIEELQPTARGEIAQLFALLALPLARRAFAGVAPPWPEASIAEIAAFLDRWRDSGWALKRSAYDALHQLILAAWYGDERSWRAIGYPGPPQLA